MRIRDMLTDSGLTLTPSEAKIVQVLLADYPLSGLGTVSSLAKKAAVSDPTVVRFVVKLGFEGFPNFQSTLLAEVEARLHSPLLMMEAKRPASAGESVAQSYLGAIGGVVGQTAELMPAQNYERAIRLLMEAKGKVVVLGGRFSRHVAGMLAAYLVQFRPGVRDLARLGPEAFDILVDLDKRDVLVVFDYRRYQADVVSFARQAGGRGAHILLFTDAWLSPIAEVSEVVMVAPIEAASPYDTLVPAVAQVEALVAQLLATEGTALRRRVEDIEQVRHQNAVTLDGDGAPGLTEKN
ncbi:MurR/RpiR family transcriptional regulator [Ancylobacter vacuolatus]|uniref:DNA-binding MurR/RpiR family transcriptional regulator n=1 Tax=Ancylobacter vacuolatus TaxID=223389 RepID=A0ABU0DJU4_9HYPH|nr:MurR/RpiR family transcriptional regulator [Ancylobacter vacuolatus]MDQ0348697.1 DNA-binding MurR/RpiR family transcriptional regulator [Ancylobacter vacuolatus]